MAVQIPRNVLELMLHAARSAYPNEFGALIRGSGDTVKELLLLPGTLQTRRSAHFRLDMLPIDSKSIGVVHSHPSGGYKPSDADLIFFSKAGGVNIIMRYPYRGLIDVAVYGKNGERKEIEVV